MKKSIKLLSLLCCLALVVSVFSACGSSSSTDSDDAAASQSEEAEEAESTEEEPAEEPAPAESAEEPAEAAPDAEPEEGGGNDNGIIDATDPSNPYNLSEDTLSMIEATWELDQEMIDAGMLPGPEKNYDADGNEISIKGAVYNYPVDGDHEISIWAEFQGNITHWIDSYADFRSWDYIQEMTGIDLTFVSVPEEVATEQFSLMIASRDYTDIIYGFGQSLGSTLTPTEAYDEEIIIRLDDLMDDYLVNYSAWLDSNKAYSKEVKDDDGHYYGVYNLNNAVVGDSGNFVRTDVLDEYGMDVPSTLAEYEDYFAACKDFGMSSVIGFNQDTIGTYCAEVYDIPGLSDAALYQIDGQVTSAYLTDNGYEYLSTLVDWYQKGYIDADVMSVTSNPNDEAYTSAIYSGNMGLFSGFSGMYSNFIDNAEPENYGLAPAGNIVMNEGDVTHFDEPAYVKTNGCSVITTDCKDVEGAALLIDWFYTDYGINCTNYGVEGVTWYWDADGHRQQTELIWNDTEFDLIPSNIIGIYLLKSRFCGIENAYYGYAFETPIVLEASQVWSADSDGAYYLNTNAISLTTEEKDIVNSYQSDMSTYVAEAIAKIVVGADELTDAWWDNFVDTVESMGLDEIIAQYQAGYDRYDAR